MASVVILMLHCSPQAPQAEYQEHGGDNYDAGKPKLLADDRQDKISVCFRQIEEFLPSFAEPLTKRSPHAEGCPALDNLESRIVGIIPWVEKRHNPAAPVVDLHDGDIEHRKSQKPDRDQVTQTGTGHHQHRQRDTGNDHGAAQVRLAEQQAQHHPQHHHVGQKAELETFDLILLARQ